MDDNKERNTILIWDFHHWSFEDETSKLLNYQIPDEMQLLKNIQM